MKFILAVGLVLISGVLMAQTRINHNWNTGFGLRQAPASAPTTSILLIQTGSALLINTGDRFLIQ